MSTDALFDAATFPLHGRRLIEASAGTGKTYNIANIYVRLLLGDGAPARTVDEILVVTFTRAATSELRGRIREKIELALRVFRKDPRVKPDAFVLALFQRYQQDGELALACRRLNAALLRMDEACIFTIHGFAVRAIQAFLFETGALADVELSDAGNARQQQALADLWRQLQLSPDALLQAYVDAAGFNDYKAFSKYFGAIPLRAVIEPAFTLPEPLPPVVALLPAVEQAVTALLQTVRSERQRLEKQWRGIRDVFAAQVSTGKTGLEPHELDELLTCIDGWFTTADPHLVIPPRNRRPTNKIPAFIKAGGEAAEVMAAIIAHAEASRPLSAYQQPAFRALLLQWLRARLSTLDPAAMQLDEVVLLINRTLASDEQAAAQLRSVITGTYPVCLVDEFQDTDPAQFEMFNALYREAGEGTGFFMIGDPKQSIYAFRGADIFAYLDVRQQVVDEQAASQSGHIFSLGTNFRSKAALVEVTNRLFAENEAGAATFLYPGIEYMQVDSCETLPHPHDKGSLRVQQASLPTAPLVFIGNTFTGDNAPDLRGDSLRWQFAHDAAARIAALLDPASGVHISHNALDKNALDKNALDKPLQAGDIAVLVRTGREAQVMRDALLAQTPRIGSVYQSQRDSVFSSAVFAQDLYHLLCAMHEPGEKSLLKTAVATPLYRAYGTDFSLLDALDNDDAVLEACIAEFSDYQQLWQAHGVLTALQALAARRALMEGFAAYPACDRLVTDWRHLGELLQQQYLVCGSREQLVLWYARQLQDDSAMDEDSKRIRLESDDNLVKIVTIHVSKGLEYPIVFLPFFFLPWQPDARKVLPLYHDAAQHYMPVVDFTLPVDTVSAHMRQESCAEDMRLLYVAITRAVHQCYIGISAAVYGPGKSPAPLFPLSVWAHLLSISEQLPDWPLIQAALQQRLGESNPAVAYQTLFDTCPSPSGAMASTAPAALCQHVAMPLFTASSWVITSYSALVNTRRDPGLRRGGTDEVITSGPAVIVEPDWQEHDAAWQGDIRYRLKSSNRTGDCLHTLYEQLALFPQRYVGSEDGNAALAVLVQALLRQHSLDLPADVKPAFLDDTQRDALQQAQTQAVTQWLAATLATPLQPGVVPGLQALFQQRAVLPELAFDFAIGQQAPSSIDAGINAALQAAGVDAVGLPGRDKLTGLLTGAIDLVFIHNRQVYLLDYKSNLLGKAPRFYDNAHMTLAMREHRYDLQYLIYSVAVHRYLQQRLGERYAFDDGEYRFGGVFYLFLRGMGLPDFPGHGVWFHRPTAAQVQALDSAFTGVPFAGGECGHG